MGFDADDVELGVLLLENKIVYRIPRYQRPYSWAKEEVGNLWDDLIEADDSEKPLFFGSVILYDGEEGSSEMAIVDGQQRFTTLTILFSAIRDELLGLGEVGSALANRIQGDLIETKVSFGERKEKLRVQEEVSRYFQEHYQRVPGPRDRKTPKRPSMKRMHVAYKLFRGRISELVGRMSDEEAAVSRLDRLTKSINKTRLIQITVSEQDEAYSIFETVNARGSPLEPSDLIKNHIFRNIREEGGVDSAKDRWEEMKSNLTGFDDDPEKEYDLTKFIRYHWMSKYGFTTVKDLYGNIKNSGIDMESFLDDLVSDSRTFGDILNSRLKAYFKDPLIYKFRREAEASLSNISDMKIEQSYVFILSILRNVDSLLKLKGKHRVHKALERIEVFNFVYHGVCSLPANRVEHLYSRCARTLDKSCNAPNQPKKLAFESLYSGFDGIWPSEELFVENFSELSYKKSFKARSTVRYILSQFEYHNSTEELKINRDITIEHVLPQKPSKWGLSDKEVSKYVHNIGNLVLLSRPLNGDVGNDPLETKLVELGKSELKMTRGLVDQIYSSGTPPSWGKREIEQRSADLAARGYREIWAVE